MRIGERNREKGGCCPPSAHTQRPPLGALGLAAGQVAAPGGAGHRQGEWRRPLPRREGEKEGAVAPSAEKEGVKRFVVVEMAILSGDGGIEGGRRRRSLGGEDGRSDGASLAGGGGRRRRRWALARSSATKEKKKKRREKKRREKEKIRKKEKKRKEKKRDGLMGRGVSDGTGPCGLGRRWSRWEKKRKERKIERKDSEKYNIIIRSKKSTVPEKSPKIPRGRKYHLEE